MRLKLGLVDSEREEDILLIHDLLETMAATSADYTNVMRFLSHVLINSGSNLEMDTELGDFLAEDRKVLDYILTQVENASGYAGRRAPKIPKQQLLMMMQLAQQNPMILYMMGQSPETLQKELQKYDEFEKVAATTDQGKLEKDKLAWKSWLSRYRERIQKLPQNLPGESLLQVNQGRVTVMNNNNPKFILRNYIAQKAIALAEKGDFSEVNNLLDLIRKPYDEDAVANTEYAGKIPDWASEICVTCSS